MKREIGISGGFCISFLIAVTLSKGGQHVAAGLLLLCTAIVLYVYFYREDNNLVDLRALLSLFWIGGIGVAAFQLSNWQTDWNHKTWISLGLFYLIFIWTYQIVFSLLNKKLANVSIKIKLQDIEKVNKRLYYAVAITAIVSMICFIAEVLILGYIPIFAKETHAYNTFHVTGIHYFTFSCMLVHPLTLLYMLHCSEWKSKWKSLILFNVMALSIALMCVSKFQFVLTVMLPVIIFLLWVKNINWKKILPYIVSVGLASVFILIIMVYRRNYEPGYLNGIFDMKNPDTPILFQYIYMYIANNFENFNCLVTVMSEQAISYTCGMRMLFPVFALTGLKFIFPHLVSFPTYVVVPELNTLTMIYDAYYDFGILGIILFAVLLGVICAIVAVWVKDGTNPIRYLFYGQVAMYQMLSFFSTWYSNPTTWFWFAVTIALYVFLICKKKRA